jgi:hypothetical protein
MACSRVRLVSLIFDSQQKEEKPVMSLCEQLVLQYLSRFGEKQIIFFSKSISALKI